MMPGDDVTGDRQTQPGAPGSAGTRLVGPVKSLENVWQIGGVDAGACVFDLHPDALILSRSIRNSYASTCGRVINGVGQDVDDRSLQLQSIARNCDIA